MQMLQKSLAAPAPKKAAPAAAPAAVPAEPQMAGFYDSVQRHKERMMTEALIAGTASLYRR
jgi:hypothetical protein